MGPATLLEGGRKLSCGSCVYIDKKSATDIFCRRYPPTLVVAPDKKAGPRVRQFYPNVHPDLDWCGEYSVWPADSVQ